MTIMKRVSEAFLAPILPDNRFAHSAEALTEAARQYQVNRPIHVLRGAVEMTGTLLSVRVLNGKLEGVIELDDANA